MADTVKTTWLYPLNWDGTYPGDGGPDPTEPWYGWKKMRVKFTNYSDGTGESAVVKLARGSLRGPDGFDCGKIIITKIQWQTYGMGVRLYWDMAPDQLIYVMGQNTDGCVSGPFAPDLGIDSRGKPIRNYGENETGNLLLTTNDHTANDSYEIILDITISTLSTRTV